MSIVVPAILPQSRADLEEKLALLAEIPAVSAVQIDAIDGRFATPACWPYSQRGVLEAMARAGQALPGVGRFSYDIDLMADEPEAAALLWNALGATRLTIHAESARDLPGTISRVRARLGQSPGFMPELFSLGLALGSATDLSLIAPHLAQVDYVQLMGIATIGRQNQPFDKRVVVKTRSLRALAPELIIQIDGGVTLATAPALLAAGASRLVVGHALWQVRSIAAEIAKFDALALPANRTNVL